MSLFATLRKRGKKVSTLAQSTNSPQDGLGSLDLSSSKVFTSTPNLNKITKLGPQDPGGGGLHEREDDFDTDNISGSGYGSSFHSDQSQFDLEEEEVGGGGGEVDRCYLSQGKGMRQRTLGSSPNILSVHGQNPSSSSASTLKPSKKPSFSPSGSLRSFMSLVSMASTLKRSSGKSGGGSVVSHQDKKTLHGSAIQLESGSKPSTVGFPSGPASGGGHPSTGEAEPERLTESQLMKGSKSVPNISRVRSKVKGHSHEASSPISNREPGVMSSSTSSSTTGSESGSLRLISNGEDEPIRGLGGEGSGSKRLSLGRLSPRSGSISSVQSSNSQIPEDTEEPHHYQSSINTLNRSPEEIERIRLMLQGAKKFNVDPKRGIDYLVLNNLVQRTPENVAQFLKHGEGLSKTSIGKYLGEHHELNLAVLQAFVECHDFSNVLLVEALRQFLWSFRLPGEAQKIDRIMECFAKRYCELNPEIFSSPDTCYILSYSIIMLNTALHNPNVKDKPSQEQFIRMNRDIDGGHALDQNLLISLYTSIQAEPFKIPPEDGNDLMLTFFNPDIEGWLWKQGGGYKTWKRRWFILSNNCLYYFRFTTDKTPRGIIPLENILVKPTEKMGKQNSFCLYKESHDPRLTEFIKSCKTLDDGGTVPGRHTSYNLATSTANDRERWMTAITANSSSHAFYTFLTLKKLKLQTQKGKGSTLSGRKLNKSKSTTSSNPGATGVRKSQITFPINRPSVELRVPGRDASSHRRHRHSKVLSISVQTDPHQEPHGHGHRNHQHRVKGPSGNSPTKFFISRSGESSEVEVGEDGTIGDENNWDNGNTSMDSKVKSDEPDQIPSQESSRDRSNSNPLKKLPFPVHGLASRVLEFNTSQGIRISIEDTELPGGTSSIDDPLIDSPKVDYMDKFEMDSSSMTLDGPSSPTKMKQQRKDSLQKGIDEILRKQMSLINVHSEQEPSDVFGEDTQSDPCDPSHNIRQESLTSLEISPSSTPAPPSNTPEDLDLEDDPVSPGPATLHEEESLRTAREIISGVEEEALARVKNLCRRKHEEHVIIDTSKEFDLENDGIQTVPDKLTLEMKTLPRDIDTQRPLGEQESNVVILLSGSSSRQTDV